MMLFEQKIESGAEFSTCGKFRYSLWRIWDDRPKVMFICLNPSTADATKSDPTMRRIEGFARSLGYGGFYICNCFPCVSTDPKKIWWEPDSDLVNYLTIANLSQECSNVIFAWGTNRLIQRTERDQLFMDYFPNALALKVTKDGYPAHPLYLKADLKPVPFK